jgi:hypothetical protein
VAEMVPVGSMASKSRCRRARMEVRVEAGGAIDYIERCMGGARGSSM